MDELITALAPWMMLIAFVMIIVTVACTVYYLAPRYEDKGRVQRWKRIRSRRPRA